MAAESDVAFPEKGAVSTFLWMRLRPNAGWTPQYHPAKPDLLDSPRPHALTNSFKAQNGSWQPLRIDRRSDRRRRVPGELLGYVQQRMNLFQSGK
ncbi:MAG: hypothetical protein ABSF63_05225 [Candidatus Bathyarchaeia archaeon]|jgi:hypothetical protein